MPSKVLRRSGLGFVAYAETMGWRPDVVFQIGVGYNFQELDVMRESWPDCEFVGFEPHPDVFREAKKSYPGKLHNVAVTDFTGRALLHSKHRHAEGSSLYPHDLKKGDKIWVNAWRLDGLSDKLFPYSGHLPDVCGNHVLLWLDCEGSELNALRGGVEFIKQVEVINVELTGNPPGRDWCRPGEVHNFLNDHGFLRQWHHTNRSCVGQIDAVYTMPELFKPELCCCPCQVERYHADL